MVQEFCIHPNQLLYIKAVEQTITFKSKILMFSYTVSEESSGKLISESNIIIKKLKLGFMMSIKYIAKFTIKICEELKKGEVGIVAQG